jgi:hypothetical protein
MEKAGFLIATIGPATTWRTLSRLSRLKTGSLCMARPEKIIFRWATAFQSKGMLADGGHKGRHRLLDHAQAKAAADIFRNGYKQNGSSTTLPYLSIRECISTSPELQQIQWETGASNRTILRSIKRISPKLRMRTGRSLQRCPKIRKG